MYGKINRRYLWCAAVSLGGLALGLAGCGGDSNSNPTATVTSLNVAPTNSSVQVKQSVQLTATGADQAGNPVSLPAGEVTWQSSNQAVASVNASGTVTGVGNGSAQVTATDTRLSLQASTTIGVQSYQQTNLVSDIAVTPAATNPADPDLVNPWGIALSPTSPFWINDNHTGLSTLYDGTGAKQGLRVTIPPPAGASGLSSPTGMVFNNFGSAGSFTIAGGPSLFIFSTEDGTISAWNQAAGTKAILTADRSASGAVYKGLASASIGSSNFLYATNFHAGTVDAFDANFGLITPPSASTFQDPNIPAGFAPFGIQNIGGSLYVTYAKQQPPDNHDDQAGPGNGFVDIFSPGGALIRRFASQGTLNSPWGVAVAPSNFGPLSNDILVANFGDGRINAFDPNSGALVDQLRDSNGNPVVIPGLWAITFGNGGRGGQTNILYFTAGIPGGGNVEDHGLFGSLQLSGGAVQRSVIQSSSAPGSVVPAGIVRGKRR